jgi:hypothetical protein
MLLARSLSGFTAEPQGARLTQAEQSRELQFTRNAQTITAPTPPKTPKLLPLLHFTALPTTFATPTHATSQYTNPCLLLIEPASVSCEALLSSFLFFVDLEAFLQRAWLSLSSLRAD